MIINLKSKKIILALGAEQDTRLSIHNNSKVFFSEIISTKNQKELEQNILDFLKQYSIKKPDLIISDLHPEYISTKTADTLSKKWKIPHEKIQHHTAHFFSSIGEYYFLDRKTELSDKIIGIICDGTGYGYDDTIWGGEILLATSNKSQVKSINRLGHLEKQILLGGELAINEPARMLMSILNNFLSKEELYKIIKQFYNQNNFNLLYSQLNQNFNCQETSSCARILDAACALLFKCNTREYKHQAATILEKNSSTPYEDLQPVIIESRIKNQELKILKLQTTPLFQYLISNLNRDKNRLAATVHKYLADGLYQIAYKKDTPIFFSGGMANNKIFHKYFSDKGVLINKKIPSGDPGIAFGQISYHLLS